MMVLFKNNRTSKKNRTTKIPIQHEFSKRKLRNPVEKPFLNYSKELHDLWSMSEGLLNPNNPILISRIHSHKKGNFNVDYTNVSSVNEQATELVKEKIDEVSLNLCESTLESERRYSQLNEALSTDCKQRDNLVDETLWYTRQLHTLCVAVTHKTEITFFNEILSVSKKLIELAPQLEKEILSSLLTLIPVPLCSYYLSQKGKFKDMESLSLTDKLKKVCQNYLEMSVQSPPVIHRTPLITQDLVEKLEQLINETKQAKRMTFKTAEEIKQVILDASGVEVETSSSEDRNNFIHTSIELYDSMFHLVRMFKINGNEELYTATAKELKRMELLLMELELEAIETIGEKIDPAYMQGVAVVPSVEANGLEQYVVYDEIRKGFKDLKENRVIREAQVITVLN